MSSKEPPGTTIYQQLQIWQKLLDAQAVSAGSEGVCLHASPETWDLESVREAAAPQDIALLCRVILPDVYLP
jgi:hypothetical protein